MLPVAFIGPDHLLAGAGGLAAAIAIGAFVCQAVAVFGFWSEVRRRRITAAGGVIGLALIIGLILLSARAR